MPRHGSKEATTSIRQIENWWQRRSNSNVAIATGDVSGIVVIDLDGEEGIGAFDALCDLEGGEVRTLTANTGGGGVHLVYSIPDDLNVSNSARRLGPKIDVRGNGGYIVAAPSLHNSGRHYEWVDPDAPVAPLPGWITKRLMAVRPSYRDIEVVLGGEEDSPYGMGALNLQLQRLEEARQGTRNDTLNRVAFAIFQLVAGKELTKATALDALTKAAIALGLTTTEARATIGSAARAGLSDPWIAPHKTKPLNRPVMRWNGSRAPRLTGTTEFRKYW